MKNLGFYLIALALCLPQPLLAELPQAPVRLAADVWCPHTCADSDDARGFLVDLTAAVFDRAGLQVDYRSTAWRRAIKGAEASHFDVLLGAANDEDGNLLLATGFALRDDTVFVVGKAEAVNIETPADLARYRLGRIHEYDYSDAGIWYPSMLRNGQTVLLPSSQGEFRLLELVLINRLDVAVVNRNVAEYFAAETGVHDQLRIINPQIHSYLYLGFQPSERGQKLRDLFEKHLPGFRKSQGFADLLAKYRLDAGLFEGH